MRDLTHDPQTGGKAYLAPSSMSAGNTVVSDHALAMSAPGSMPIDDFANIATNKLPLPVDTHGNASGPFPDPMPVNYPPRIGEHAQGTGDTGYHGWTDPDNGRPGDLWRQL